MRTTMKAWLIGAGVLLVSGCASQPTPPTEALFDCQALNRAVSSAHTGFAEIKGRLRTTPLTRTWQTDTQAFHDACVITAARRPDHYLCFGPLASDDPRGALVKGGEAITQCLGEGWQLQRTSADRLAFTREGQSAVVILETFLNDRGRRMGTLSVFQNAQHAAPLPSDT
ncbi:hypothetical protein [Halomonas sp.]|uniref:hypothetical protein n=1 Tax=Halomonas sp. TaxID=1486246 RepID=UPI00298DB9F6|nr:hypothetical protein [Halomonas sp.]MDW7745709.1 hypothetical protein [Halomonas sp.]